MCAKIRQKTFDKRILNAYNKITGKYAEETCRKVIPKREGAAG